LDVTPEAVEWLAIGGFDPLYGARPLRRLIQSAIGDQLAKELLAGRIRDGQTVVVDVNDDDPGALSVRAKTSEATALSI
jgi:ATP-dependent Clp protease ATP-binding subunit ClpB